MSSTTRRSFEVQKTSAINTHCVGHSTTFLDIFRPKMISIEEEIWQRRLGSEELIKDFSPRLWIYGDFLVETRFVREAEKQKM
jgi:hypothetical protein